MSHLFSLLPFAAIVAGVASLLVTLLLILTLRWHHAVSMDSGFGPQKNHSHPTPRVGGIAVFVGVLAGAALSHTDHKSLLWSLALSGTPALIFGLAEDLTKRVSVRTRLLATMACAVAGYFLTGHSITDVNVPGLDWLLGFTVISVAFTAFAVGGIANAFNIIDGMNGLSSGTCIIVLGAFAVMGGAAGDVEVVQTCLVLIGAAVGFMLLNWPLGKIFLGDGGAYFLGFSVAWMAVLVLARHPELSAWAALLVCGFPVLEVLFSVDRRGRRRQKIGAPDCLHLNSLVKRRLVRRLLPGSSTLVRNSVTGALMWAAALLPASIALHWSTDTPALVLGLVLCALLYSAIYARLTQFRWCFGANTLRPQGTTALEVKE